MPIPPLIDARVVAFGIDFKIAVPLCQSYLAQTQIVKSLG